MPYSFTEGSFTSPPSTIAHAQNASFQTDGSLLSWSAAEKFTGPSTGPTATISVTGTGFLTPR